MTVKTLNESLGYNEKANFRIYEMSDDSKINELFSLNFTSEDFEKRKSHLKSYFNNQKSVERMKELIKGVKD